tara:strand:+ start:491 stop:2584 length:2094 start_codon:yes stop_codon:yes gene_type:complete
MAQDQGLFGQLGGRYKAVQDGWAKTPTKSAYLERGSNAVPPVVTTAARDVLKTAGHIGGGIGDVFAAIAGAVVPEAVKDYAKEVMVEGYARGRNTPVGKTIVKLMKEYPDSASAIGDFFNVLGIIPATSSLIQYGKQLGGAKKNISQSGVKEGLAKTLAPNFLHNIAEQMPVHMRGGILTGDTVDLFRTLQNKFGKLPENKQKLVRTLKELYKGENKKVGTGTNFYGNAIQQVLAIMGESLDATIPALVSYLSPQKIANRRVHGVPERSINEMKRKKKEGDLLGVSGEAKMQTTIAFQNPKAPVPLLNKQDYTGPPRSLQYELPKIKEELFGGKSGVFNPVPESISNRHLAHVKAAHGLDNTQDIKILVKRPHKDSIGREVSGAGHSTGSVLQRGLANGSLLKTWKSIQTEVTKKPFKGDIPSEGMIEMMQISAGLSKSNIMKFNKAYNKNNKTNVKFGAKDILHKLVKARELRSRGIKHDTKILDTWEKNLENPMGKVRDDLGNVISNAKSPLGNAKNYNGGAHTGTTYISSNKELGGVNQIITAMIGKVEPSQRGMVYTTASDVGNLLGVGGRTGGNQMITVIPTQIVNYLKKDSYTKKGRVKHKADAKRWSNPDSKNVIKKDLKQLSETIDGMADYDVPIRLGDNVEAVKRNGKVVLIVSQIDQIEALPPSPVNDYDNFMPQFRGDIPDSLRRR